VALTRGGGWQGRGIDQGAGEASLERVTTTGRRPETVTAATRARGCADDQGSGMQGLRRDGSPGGGSRGRGGGRRPTDGRIVLPPGDWDDDIRLEAAM
jgi:hypothetical protein